MDCNAMQTHVCGVVQWKLDVLFVYHLLLFIMEKKCRKMNFSLDEQRVLHDMYAERKNYLTSSFNRPSVRVCVCACVCVCVCVCFRIFHQYFASDTEQAISRV